MENEDKKSFLLTKDTLIPVGFVLILLAGAVSYGALSQKVDTLDNSVGSLLTSSQQQNERLTKVEVQTAQVLNALVELKGDLKTVRR